MFEHLGYFVTESSGHNSEYNPRFRKRKDLLQKYTPEGGFNGETGYILQLHGKDREMAYYAAAYDPLTSAVLSLEEIRNMVDEMLEAEKAWLF